MYRSIELFPSITLRCVHSDRFKQALLSIRFLRPMGRQEAALNALIPEILLRGCESAPDILKITAKLDELYGAGIVGQVRRIGDYQSTGLTCGFLEDRFALPGERVLEPMVEFLGELLLHPVRQGDGFCKKYVRVEKRNLISALEAQRNDKQTYVLQRLLKNMCRGDSFSVPRLGEIADVRQITPRSAYEHYERLLRESPIEIFYVGSAPIERLADLLRPIFATLERSVCPLPPQTAFVPGTPSRRSCEMDVSQGKLAMGFVTPITYADPRFAAMQLLNTVFGGTSTSKLFMQLREKQSLCYVIDSGYYGSKGMLIVHAGIDTIRFNDAKAAVLEQLDACRNGQISEQEITAAKQAMLLSLRTMYDSPDAIEDFFSTAAVSGLNRSAEELAAQIRAVTHDELVEAAKTLQFHSSFFLKGAYHG